MLCKEKRKRKKRVIKENNLKWERKLLEEKKVKEI